MSTAFTALPAGDVKPLTCPARRSEMILGRIVRGLGARFQGNGGRRGAAGIRSERKKRGSGMQRVFTALAISAAIGLTGQTAAAQTLKKIQDRGMLVCGVSQGLPGFSNPDDRGNWSGLDVEFCRAIAAAIFNDARKVKFTPLSAKDRFESLRAGEIDVLSRNTTWTLSRDVSLNFAAVNYYDGQGFMARKALKVNSALELNGATVCTQTGTTTELNLADYFRAHKMKYEVVAFASADETVKAYETGRCDVFTTDVSQLFAERLKLGSPNDHMILPEIISKEPLGPAVRHGDDQWSNIVKWTHFAMINAEELGVSSKTIDDALKSELPEIRRLVGTEGNYGEQLGLTKDWVVRIVRQVGNYGEVFERTVGSGSKLGIARELNNLWNKGGIQYAPPIR
jgi:general L-amino acid transport system substrate-binding protein